MALTVEQNVPCSMVPLHTPDKRLICSAAGDARLVRADSDQNATRQGSDMVRTDRGSRLSSGEISGGEDPRTLVQNSFLLVRDYD